MRADRELFSSALTNSQSLGVYWSRATFLPARSSTERMSPRAMIASPPRVLSATITALPSKPAPRSPGCSWAKKSTVRQLQWAVPEPKLVAIVGMSSWSRNSRESPCWAKIEPGLVFSDPPLARMAGA